MRERQPAEPHVCSRHPLDLMVLCPTFAFFNEEVIGGLAQGDAAGDSFRASAGSCASANRSNRTSAAAISCLLQGHPAGLHGAVPSQSACQTQLFGSQCVDHRRRGKLCLHFFLIGASIEVPSASRLSFSARFHRKRMQAYQPA
jgi:hypothetical protein